MKLLNVQTKALEEVADPASAIAAGSHAPKRDETFTWRNPEDGGVYEASGAELRDIIRAGGVLETETDRKERELKSKYAHSEVLAGAAAAARGLTFGLSDAALSAAGLGEDVKALKEANPYSSILGEIGGIIVPTLLTGGASGAVSAGAKAATSATRGVAKGAMSLAEQIAARAVPKAAEKLAAKTMAGALEGAAYGLGQTVSEASLGEPANVAENLLVGGAFGSAVPLFTAAVGALGKKTVEKGLPAITALISGADRTELEKFYKLDASGKKARQLVKAGPDVVKERLVEIARENDDLAKTAGKYFGETKMAAAEDMLQGLKPEDVAVRTGAFEKLRIAFTETLGEFRANPNRFESAVAREIEGIADDFVRQMSQAPDAVSGFKALDELKSRLYAAAKVTAKDQTPQQINASKRAKSLLNMATDMLEDESIWGRPAAMQKKMNSAYTDFVDAKKAFEQRFTSKFGTERRVDARKILNYSKNQGTPEVADAAQALDDYLRTSNRLRDVISEFGGPGKLGKFAAEGAEGKLRQTLDEMATLKSYEQMGNGNNRLSFGGGFGLPGVRQYVSMFNPTGKFAVSVLGAADGLLQKTNTEWMKNVAGAVKSLSSAVPASLATTVKDLGTAQEKGEQILALAGNPTALGEKMAEATGQLQVAAPKAAAQMQEQMARTVQYLAQKVPGNPTQGMLGADPDWKPSDAELAVWNRHLVASERPMVLLEDLQSGHLAPETVETVKTLYPNFYNKTVAAVMQLVAENKPSVPFEKRVQLSILTGQPIEPALKPDTLLALQMSYASAQAQAKPMGNPAKSRIPEANMTPGQRLSSR